VTCGVSALDGDNFIAMLSCLITLEKFPPEVGRALLWLLLQLFYCLGLLQARFLNVSERKVGLMYCFLSMSERKVGLLYCTGPG